MQEVKGQLWSRDTRESGAAGVVRLVRLSADKIVMLGQGSTVSFHGRVYSLDTNA